MTDRELLELAAKAAGVEIRWNSEHGIIVAGGKRWNPLTDDGDALRLAVKLRLCVSYFNPNAGPHGATFVHGSNANDCLPGIEENQGTDDLAATRRAIVRAAAEIGRAMG